MQFYASGDKQKKSNYSLEQYVYMGDSTIVKVDFLGVVRLQLSIECFWNCGMWCTYPKPGEI